MQTTVTRTVRFRKDEIALIEKFLVQNELFDFSTLVRHSVAQFIVNPKVPVTPVRKDQIQSKGGVQNV